MYKKGLEPNPSHLVEASGLVRPQSGGKRSETKHYIISNYPLVQKQGSNEPKQTIKKGSSVVLLPFYCYAKRSCVLVEASGLEPPTPTLSGWCSNLLSYASILNSFRHRASFFYFGTTPEDLSKYLKSTWWGRWFVNIFYVQKRLGT